MAVAASLTSTTGLSSVMGTIYDKQLLFREKQELVFEQLAWVKELPGNMGKTIRFAAYRPLAVVTLALTEGSTSSHTEFGFKSREVTVIPEEWGATAPISTLYSMTKLDPALVEQVDIVADQRNRSIDRQYAIEVGQNGVFPLRADGDGTLNEFGLRIITSGSNSVTKFKVHADDDGVAVASVVAGSIICITEGTNYGQTFRVASVSTKGDGAHVTIKSSGENREAVNAFDSTDRFAIFVSTGTVEGDGLDSTNLRAARKHLRRNRAPKYDGNAWLSTVAPETEYDFLGDSTFVLTSQYSNAKALYNGEMGMWMGIRFLDTTAPYRELLAGTTEMDTGGLIHNMVFGRKAFGVGKITGGNQGIVVLQGPEKSDPLNMQTIVGWKAIFQPRALTSLHCVSIISGATDVAIA